MIGCEVQVGSVEEFDQYSTPLAHPAMKFIALAPSATGTSWIVGAETPVPPWVVVTTVSPETAVPVVA